MLRVALFLLLAMTPFFIFANDSLNQNQTQNNTQNNIQNFPDQPPFLPTKAVTVSLSAPVIPNTPIPLELQSDLTLQQAIYLGLRHNTDLLTSLNNRQLQNFDLLTAEQKFQPQFTLNNSITYAKTSDAGTPDFATQSASVGPGMTWTLPLGTQLQTSVNYDPTHQSGTAAYSSDQFGYSITVTQPLLQNFGTAVNEVDLNNAYDQQIIDDLTLRKTTQTTIINVANAYYAVAAAEQSYQISERSFDNAQKELTKRQAKLAAGQIPATDVTQAQIDLMTQQQSLESASEALSTAKADFLNTLGLPPETRFSVEDQVDIKPPTFDLSESLKSALKNNIDLKIQALQSEQDSRNIKKSQNSRLWQLNLVVSGARSHSDTDYDDPDSQDTSQLSSNSSVALNLSIPLNQVTLDQTELSSAIALENQQISEAQEKRTVINNVISAVHNLQSQWLQLQISQEKLTLSQASFKAAQVEYHYGKIDAFSLQQQQQSAIDSEQNVVDLKISYLKQYMAYEQLVGTLLDHWHVNVTTQNTQNNLKRS